MVYRHIFATDIGQRRKEEAVIIFRATKGARFVASSSNAKELDVRAARDR